ncbi:hypothetical protein NL676_013300 [Syzygium grande]|nr:hypothetical protein NL676_013300 [Syzygium grande]
MQVFELDGFQLPNITELHVVSCVLLEKFRLPWMSKLKVVDILDCPKLVEIQFPRESKSLEALSIQQCQSLESLAYSVRNDEVSYRWEGTISLPSRSFKKLQRFILGGCPEIYTIDIPDTLESLEYFTLFGCPNVESLRYLPNLKNLKYLRVFGNDGLQGVRLLHIGEFPEFGSLTTFENAIRNWDPSSWHDMPNDCHIDISGCEEGFRGSLKSYRHQKVSLTEPSLYNVVNI